MTEATPADSPAEATPAETATAEDGARRPRRAVTLRLDLRTLAALGLAGAGFITGTLVMSRPAATPAPGAQPAQTPVVPSLTAAPVQLGTDAPTPPAPQSTPTLPLTPASAVALVNAPDAPAPTVSGLSPAPVPPVQNGERNGPTSAPLPTVTVTVTHMQAAPTVVAAPSPTGGPGMCVPPASPTGEVGPTPGPVPTVTPTPTSAPVTPARPTPSR
ncbi:hypothetical protein ACIQI7_09200 [Kitasatospora sp. NPDC092039]|uniref:hypothetical protein n=1 Tax=Kitasatospora sp. NPDC092039 TaxID=3364086 RepID=UPI0038305C72